MTTQHSTITDPNLHEPKGIAAQTSGKIYVSDGLGSGAWTAPSLIIDQGLYNYNDLATASTPIALTTPGTYYDLTNDTLGPATILDYQFTGIDLWDPATNRFDWSGLSLGDSLDMRIDIVVTTTAANTGIECILELATGSGTPITIPMITATNFKTAGTYQQTRYQGVGMLSTLVQSNPARLRMKADTAGATVKVNGWYMTALRKIAIV